MFNLPLLLCIIFTLNLTKGQNHNSFNDYNHLKESVDFATEQINDLFKINHDEIMNKDFGLMRSSSSNHNPSYNLHKHSLHYVPEGFHIKQYDISSKKRAIKFTYQKNDSIYDKYLFRIRYHGYHEYATDIKPIIKNESGVNQLIMNDFHDDEYIVCVTFFANNITDVQPLSLSGMCLDVLIGEENTHNEHETLTGLLSPLLLAVAAIFLIFIAIFDFSMKRVKAYKKKKADSSPKEVNADDVKSNHSTIQLGSQMNKNDLSKIFHQVERRGSVWDERVTGRLVRASESDQSFINTAYTYDDSDELDQNKSSLDSLSHLLDSKPWRSAKRPSVIDEEPAAPSFYLKTN